MNKLNTPQALIPENTSYYVKDGKQIRKGTMASAILNVEILESIEATIIEKNEALKTLKELAPVLCAFGLNKHFVWKNPIIQVIFDNENRKNKI